MDANAHARPAQLGTGVSDKGTVGGVIDTHDPDGHSLLCDACEHRLQHIAVVQAGEGVIDLGGKGGANGDHDLGQHALLRRTGLA